MAQEHWCSSGFANTELHRLLKKHGVHKIIVIGLIAHTWVEATTRYAAELGYEVTVVKDATRELFGRDDARRSGNQFTQLCERDREHG